MKPCASGLERVGQGLGRDGWALACAQLVQRAYVVIDAWLEDETVARLRARAIAQRDTGRLRPAGLGRAGERVDTRRRGDAIAWLEPPSDAPRGVTPDVATASDVWLWQRLDALREALNAELWAGLVDFEAHYAWYPPGAHYEPHVDRLRHDDRRLISAVLYLNDAWDVERDGGALRLFVADGAPVDVAPTGGRLVLFRSDALRHAVLPARRDRYSVAAWYRRRGTRPL